MRLISAFSTLLLASGFVNGNTAPEPGTQPESTPTKTTAQSTARETTPSLLGTLFKIANTFDLRACVPGALPLITALPKIPPALIKQGAIQQALSQTTRDLDHVCEFSVTGPVGETFTEFLPTWYAWYHENSARVASVVSKCPKAGALVSTIEAYETCSQVVAQLALASATATATADGEESEGTGVPAPETTDSPGEDHDGGFLGAAAAAAAGVLGVVAVL